MTYIGIFKRIVPFFLTFAAGLFIASFFVTIASPNFNFRRGSHKHREMQRLRSENEELKRNACELRKQNEQLRKSALESEIEPTLDFPAFESDAPPPPPPPRKAPRNPRFDK